MTQPRISGSHVPLRVLFKIACAVVLAPFVQGRRQRLCDECYGRGMVRYTSELCPRCGGTGIEP